MFLLLFAHTNQTIHARMI